MTEQLRNGARAGLVIVEVVVVGCWLLVLVVGCWLVLFLNCWIVDIV